LTPDDIERAHRAIVAGKTAVNQPSAKKHGRIVVKGGEGTARMAIRLFRAILSWAKLARVLPAGVSVDLVASVEIGRDGQRDLILQDQDAYARLWSELDRMIDPTRLKEDETAISVAAADAIRVVVLTGARRGEIAGLRWRHVDLKVGKLVLPIDEHKTGRKTGKPRVIGLPTLAQAIIARQPAGDPDDVVFRPSRGGERLDIGKPMRRLRDAVGLPKGAGLHLLRHSLATTMAESGSQAFEIAAVMGHRDIKTSAKYVHMVADRAAARAEKAASGIVAAVTGKDDATDNVTNIADAR
jgi:integrase